MELAINIVGTLAAISMLCGYLPQSIYTMRTRDTDGIALPTFLAMGFGSLFFTIQGILMGNWPLLITNFITTICCIIITTIKLQNMRKKHRESQKS